LIIGFDPPWSVEEIILACYLEADSKAFLGRRGVRDLAPWQQAVKPDFSPRPVRLERLGADQQRDYVRTVHRWLAKALADAEFDSEANHEYIRQRWRARSIIPAKPRRGIPRGGTRYQMYRAFPQKEYGQRAKIETIFSVIKRKLSSRAPGRTLPVQIRQALLLGLTYNLYRLRHRLPRRRCQQSPFKSFVLEVRILKGLRADFA